MRHARLAAVPFVLLGAIPALGAPAPHLAHYDIVTPDGKPVGTLDFSLHGNACSGYEVETVTVTSPDGKEHVQGRTTHESADGRRYDFGETDEVDGKTVRDVHGTAQRTDVGIDVTVTDTGGPPVTTSYPGDVTLPTEYDMRVISAALSGHPTLVTAHVFTGVEQDGSRAPVVATTTIAPNVAGDDLPKELRGLRSFRLTTRFFPDHATEGGEASHVVESIEFEDGVEGEIIETTGGVSLGMRLSGLEMVDQAPCKVKAD